MKLDIATTLLALLPVAAFAKDVLSFDGSMLRKKAASKKIDPLPSMNGEDDKVLTTANVPGGAIPALSVIAGSLCTRMQTDETLYSIDLGGSDTLYCDEEGVGLVINAATTEIAEHLELKRQRREQGEVEEEELEVIITIIIVCLNYCWSRQDLKRDIQYLDANSRNQIGQMVLDMPLATWNYNSDAPDTPQRLGFMIDDIEPSFAVQDQIGNSVNTYGFVSMATAAIQMQQEQIQELQVTLKKLGVHVDQA